MNNPRRRPGSRLDFRAIRPINDTIRLEGIDQTIKVVDDESAEKADFLICMRLIGNTANLAGIPTSRVGKCSRCNQAVYWSEVAPKTPPRLCLVCFEADRAKAKVEKEEKAARGEIDEDEEETFLWTTGAVVEDANRAIARADALAEMLMWEKPEKNAIN